MAQYLKIAAVDLVATYVGKNTDSWFNFTFILGVPCVVWGGNWWGTIYVDRDLNYTSKEKAMLQHDFRITFFFNFICRDTWF